MNQEKSHFAQPPKDRLFAIGRAVLFEMDPEKAHDLALKTMSCAPVQRMLHSRYQAASQPASAFGLEFDNPVGLAAGLDKNADYIDALGAMGFGHIEVGTVTPKPQSGNPRPRIFRLAQHEGLINRLGFNNKGVHHLVQQVQKRRYTGKLGINIGKNASTPLENANDDYLYCLEQVYAFADYITINISSPNTAGLRDLQHGKALQALLELLKNAQSRLATEHQHYVPVAVKIAPDLSEPELDDFCAQMIKHEIDAMIVGNTTNTRPSVGNHLYAGEMGGLSGRPLRPLANQMLSLAAQRLDGKVALVGVGGINCGDDAAHKLDTGASLVQLYSGVIYHGPALVRDCIEASCSRQVPSAQS